MKTFKSIILSFCFLSICCIASAQDKTEKIVVAGECGMCKTSIEKAAKSAGASYALWDVDAKILTVKYNSTSTNTAKIEKAVAGVGYDTKNVTATNDAYDKLHACCKYERNANSKDHQQCADHDNCKKAGCMKDGKCIVDAACCKTEKGETKACCKTASH